ncbi:hypothetical protein KY362_05460 [Candidatus Woesearchaeota archaeon]|nr:hypothetical protein [Candidatus Woesearchaeota archaeon]
MVLKQIGSTIRGSEIVGELYRCGSVFASFSQKEIRLSGTVDCKLKKGSRGELTIESRQLEDLRDALSEWYAVKDSLWGRQPIGECREGHQGDRYFPPNITDSYVVEQGESPDPLGVGELERTVERNGLTFTFERFGIRINRDSQEIHIDDACAVHLPELIDKYEVRRPEYVRERYAA